VFYYLEHHTQAPCNGYKQWKYWLFIASATVLNLTVHVPNLIFLVAGVLDARRAAYALTQLTYAMENNNFRKNYGSIGNPLFNFMDLTSLLTWMDLRTLIMDIGFKYRLRIHIYSTAWVAAVIGNVTVTVLFFFGYGAIGEVVDVTTDFILTIIMIVFFQSVLLACQIVPNVYINEQTEKQIAQFNEIRHFLHRMLSDQDILMMPANELAAKIKPPLI